MIDANDITAEVRTQITLDVYDKWYDLDKFEKKLTAFKGHIVSIEHSGQNVVVTLERLGKLVGSCSHAQSAEAVVAYVKQSWAEFHEQSRKEDEAREMRDKDTAQTIIKAGKPKKPQGMDSKGNELYEAFKYVWSEGTEHAAKESWGMAKMYLTDAMGLFGILKMWNQKDYEQAIRLAWEMDTAAREHIPQSVWDVIWKFE